VVAIIDSGDISDVLSSRQFGDGESTYSVAWRQSEWRENRYHLALLLDDDNELAWIGRARGRRRVSDRERRVEVVDIEYLAGPSLTTIRARMPESLRSSVQLGILPDDVGALVTQLLVSMFPDRAEAILRLGRQDTYTLPPGNRGAVRNEQRDATGLLLEAHGLSRDPLRDLDLLSGRPSFRQGSGHRSVSEEVLIQYDLNHFPTLIQGQADEVDWHLFDDGRRRMFILYSNREPIEQALGVDVVYFNDTYGAFVLVQYKRLVRESNLGVPCYRPDDQLAEELARMQTVDHRFGKAGAGDFRLYRNPCWIKLCNSRASVEDPADLIKGMYLSREHFVELMDVCKGPRGGVSFSYETVPKYLNNTLFAQLVRDGWLGTTGVSTAELGEIVNDILESRRAVVLGIPVDAERGRRGVRS
jgi:hypothetical protein